MLDQLHVLIVDDPVDRRAVRQALQVRYEDAFVEEAATYAEATAAITAQHFDCILLNHKLPDGDGMHWLATFRMSGDTTPVIILAGHNDDALALEAISADAADYLPKDKLTPQLLDQCLRSALRFHLFQEQTRKAQQALLRDIFSSVTQGKMTLCGSEDDLPEALERFADPIRLSTTDSIRELRRQALAVALILGMPEDRRNDLETAVGEMANNAFVHAGMGIGHVFTNQRGTVQVRVEDKGQGIAYDILPRAALEKGWSSVSSLGYGFWLMLNMVDRVWLLTSGAGTTVVIEQRTAPLPPYFENMSA